MTTIEIIIVITIILFSVYSIYRNIKKNKRRLFEFLDSNYDDFEFMKTSIVWRESISIEYGRYNVYFHKDFIAVTEIPNRILPKIGLNNLKSFYIGRKTIDSIDLNLFWNYIKIDRLYLDENGDIKIFGYLDSDKQLFESEKENLKNLIELTIQTKIKPEELIERFQAKNIEIDNWC